MQQKFQTSFSKVINKEDTLILAVSGGVDSMVLLDLVSKYHPKQKIILAHFDHCLRGAESDGDRAFVVEYCRMSDIKSETEKLDITTLAKDEKMSIENAARTYRYEFLSRVAKKYGAKYILTAHHCDDRIETAVFNLIRGTKLGGIHALSTLSARHCDEGNNPVVSENNSMDCHVDSSNLLAMTGAIFRPLLNISKDEIRAYARENTILSREDSTNADTLYQRNYLRHEILPRFEKINPEYRHAMMNFIDYTEELKSWIDREVEKFLVGKNEFSAKDFAGATPFFQKEIIRHLYETTNNGTVGLSEGNIEEIQRFILSAHGGTKKTLGNLSLKKKEHIITYSN